MSDEKRYAVTMTANMYATVSADSPEEAEEEAKLLADEVMAHLDGIYPQAGITIHTDDVLDVEETND